MQAFPGRVVTTTKALRPRAPFVCTSCHRARRPFSASTSRRAPPHPPEAGYARLTSRRLISIGGEDAAKFLQGLITSSIIGRSGGFYSGFLTATGRVLHDVFTYPDTAGLGVAAKDPTVGPDKAFLIEVDKDQADALMKHIKRYKLRSKISHHLLPEGQVTPWQVWDSREGEPRLPTDQEGAIVMKDGRAPGMGYRVIRKGEDAPQVDAEQSDDDGYRIRRYLLGVAEGSSEIVSTEALPLSSNMDLMGGIDFRKGCYVGQELTIRTKHRGVVRRRILPCVIYGEEEPATEQLEYKSSWKLPLEPSVAAEDIPGGQVIGRARRRGFEDGEWLRGIGNIGLALCRLQTMTDIKLPGDSDEQRSTTEGSLLKWGTGAEGDREKAVRVKAFVPEWLRKGIDESNSQQH